MSIPRLRKAATDHLADNVVINLGRQFTDVQWKAMELDHGHVIGILGRRGERRSAVMLEPLNGHGCYRSPSDIVQEAAVRILGKLNV